MALYRQIWALTEKTLRIVITRHISSTVYSALVLPIVLTVYIGIGQKFTQPDDKFGIGSPVDIFSLETALSKANGGRDTVVFVNSGHTGGDIERIVDSISDTVTRAGKNATTIQDESDLGYICRGTIRGTSNCFGAVVFYSSPDEGSDDFWNYTLRADAGLGGSFRTDKGNNDAQIYALPLQRAVDAAIAGLKSGSSFPETTQQYPYTELTEDEHQAELRRKYQSSFIKYLSVSFLAAMIGVCYHMPGFIATEREKGMSQLIDAMMPTRQGWHRQFARLISNHHAFIIAYMPGWIVASIVARVLIWTNTSFGILIIFFLLSGIAMTSMSLLGASFFKKAQLSGIVTAVTWLVLGIVAQVVPHPSTAAVAVLSLLFTPCNFVYFIIYIARFEQDGKAADLAHAPPSGTSRLPGIVHWIFFIIQMIVYPAAAASVERALHGVSTGTRKSTALPNTAGGLQETVRLENMTKIYKPSVLRKFFSFVSPPRPEVVAVDDLTLTAKRGEILALLGANGSGKSTTLDAIAGISDFTSGNISVDTSGGLGYAPQQNVLWDELTVEEHIRLFSRIKDPLKKTSDTAIAALIDAIGLRSKAKAWSKTLSGGQKRKLQLGLMLVGGSSVCCVDEVSSGIDPLSRRKIWDILLKERGSRTIIMTTHFLDEADLLADNIAILSKGTLRAEGSSAQLKDTYGAGYRIHVLNPKSLNEVPDIEGVTKKVGTNNVTYLSSSSDQAAKVIRALEAGGIPYKTSSPTIEDVFLHLAEEVHGDGSQRHPNVVNEKAAKIASDNTPLADENPALLTGRQIGMVQQTGVLLRKRFTVLKTNWLPYAAAFLVPIVAAAVIQLLVRNDELVGCSPTQRSSHTTNDDFFKLLDTAHLVGGPSSKFDSSSVEDLFKPMLPTSASSRKRDSSTSLGNITIDLVDSLASMEDFIEKNRRTVTPAGLWLGDSNSAPTLAFKTDNSSMYSAVLGQSFLDTILANTTIATSYKELDYPVAPSTGRGLQLVVYFAVACSIFPGLFGLYPNTERLKNVRSLQYSSGVRTLPVWAAHVIFDFGIIAVPMILAAMLLVVSSDSWYNGGYLFPIFIFYGLTTIIISYLFSLLCASPMATYAMTSVVQSVGFAVYIIAYLFILTLSPAAYTDRNVLIAHWIIAAIFPTGSLVRALMVGQNIFSTTCDNDRLQPNPAAMVAYGGPLLYLILQAIFWFSIVIWIESGAGRYAPEKAKSSPEIDDPEIAEELVRVDGPDGASDGLRVVHLTKAFGKNTAVDNITFGVEHGEVFALLGPNGAGKSTTISLIRGDIAPSRNGGDVFVEGVSITKHRAAARAKLGVCPQFDAIDNMTVREHLRHYSRLRGIPDVDHQVPAVLLAVGLEAYADVMAHTLSGGNKRKLSLGIALTGNPPVMLLDEPSSGLDAAAKRIMWRTLEAIVPGRSILLTTHSMEEADALATRAGIMARRMLALGSTDALRHRFGDTLHVHLVAATAPHSSAAEMDALRAWVLNNFPGAEVEQETFHGQMRFSMPSSAVPPLPVGAGAGAANTSESARGRLLIMLEEQKGYLGVAHYSVSPTTLNEVFLNIVGKHDVQEEGYTTTDGGEKKPWWKSRIMRRF
ncbi:P-loop containing nucleoside triphosphate hydrolase protein [Trichoderma citrinoviride]|uniref:P-loop containing nucleoside triphosphate hydrolase protein n=1 Tax=Trichoderma citrinoviride TaxID=58853 RepID=A0A2T4B5S2_9HYPO|nr:P-loop containing nucleoside triphosphate hydrolase protein [Trichoderma citrinoviride]PTB64675.1 P-loop containing nucleoside triphosphate hydrolase protein [Trichoderma citrinoviride]